MRKTDLSSKNLITQGRKSKWILLIKINKRSLVFLKVQIPMNQKPRLSSINTIVVFFVFLKQHDAQGLSFNTFRIRGSKHIFAFTDKGRGGSVICPKLKTFTQLPESLDFELQIVLFGSTSTDSRSLQVPQNQRKSDRPTSCLGKT